MRRHLTTAVATAALMALATPGQADMEAARAFLDAEIGELSTLSRAEQEAEMQWFIGDHPHAQVRVRGPGAGLQRHHGHPGDARPDR